MKITAADLLRAGLTGVVLMLAYGHLGSLLRFLLPGRVRHGFRAGVREVQTPLAEALHAAGFRYLGLRVESVLGMHRRATLAYGGPSGRVADIPLSGRLSGSYLMTWFEGDRCALTRCGRGRGVAQDRYESRVVAGALSLEDLLDAHGRTEAAVSLGYPPMEVRTAADRLALADRWYRVYGRRELLRPALLEATLASALLAFSVYLWL